MKRLIRKVINLPMKVFPKLELSYRIDKFLENSFDSEDWNGVPFSKDYGENIRLILSEEEQKDAKLVESIKRDMVKYYLLYGITPDEFLLYDCRNKSEKYVKTILSRCYKDKCCFNNGKEEFGKSGGEIIAELKDKWMFYNMAKPFFKRAVCRVDADADFAELEDFCAKHRRFIAKPRFASSGIGVHVVDLQSNMMGSKELFEYYKQFGDGKWLFEEFIEQDSLMAEWHPSSVNTIRVPSIMTKDGPVVILPLFRTGKNGNIVDNCHNDGGLMAVPDAKTGVLLTDGYDVFTNVVEIHPNSGKKFKGWQVPEWDSLIATAAELHKSLPPYHKYVGFDFALTNKGWVVVEGNWGNFPHQVCVGYGIRNEFERLMKS